MIKILHTGSNSVHLDELRAAGVTEVDLWSYALEELRQLDALVHVDPDSPAAERLDLDDDVVIDAHTRYVYYPWRHTLARIPDAELYYRLRTARNRHLLTGTDQNRWSSARIGVAGLSVGFSALRTCALTGARHFHLADPDVLAPTNLNRIDGSLCDVGTAKIDLAARRLLEADPYTELTFFRDGYVEADADDFLGVNATPLDVVIEEIDDIAGKIDLRRRARAHRIPVVSATDMGDNVVIDVERYDLDDQYPIFHGRGEAFDAAATSDPEGRLRMAAALVGDTLTPRMAFSASQLGRSIASWPQLGSTAAMAGAVVATVTRNIVCGRSVASGRYVIDMESMFLGGSETETWNELSADQVAGLLAALGVTDGVA